MTFQVNSNSLKRRSNVFGQGILYVWTERGLIKDLKGHRTFKASTSGKQGFLWIHKENFGIISYSKES